MTARDEIGILIVDPSETYQRILTAILRKLGFPRVVRASNPLKAQVLLEHDKSINVVICELVIPEPAHGLNFVAQIRGKFSSDQLPILMMTSLAERQYVQQAIRSGVNGYLIKPINPDHLEAHLWRLFDLPLRGPQKMGEFLVAEQIISNEQRELALNFQKAYSSENVDISLIALYLGFVKEHDLKEVFVDQMDDEAFLDHGGALGMTPQQVAHLRKVKKRFHLRLGDVLVRLGFVDKEDLENALERFRVRCISMIPEEQKKT
ncbi:MAG: response regulator [Acidobacteriota bacterium]|nr:response regulator [Acidobacteriota bacterium]